MMIDTRNQDLKHKKEGSQNCFREPPPYTPEKLEKHDVTSSYI